MPLLSGQRRRDSLAKPADVCRIAVLGESQTGKTSLVRQFLEFKFSQKYRPTVDDILQLSYQLDDVTYDIELVDAAGGHEFPAMRKLYIDTSDAFIIVMSIDSPESIEEARRLQQVIRDRRTSINKGKQQLQSSLSVARQSKLNNSTEAPRIVFVLNKMDLQGEDCKVEVSDVQHDPDFGFENVVVVSAKENWNVDEAFSRLVTRQDRPSTDGVQMEKSLEAALQHRRITAPAIDLQGASDSFLLALKNSIAPRHSDTSYSPIAP